MRVILSVIAFIVFISCKSGENEYGSFTEDEYKIYSIVIDSLYYQKETIIQIKQKEPKYLPHNYVLIDSTMGDVDNGIAEKLTSNGIKSSELINNFESVNAQRYSLDAYSRSVKNIKLISLEKYKNYYVKWRHLNDGGMRGFIEFSKDYPHSYGTSVFQVTRAGFSSNNSKAIIGTMHLRGINLGYDYSYLEKVGEKWVIKKIINH